MSKIDLREHGTDEQSENCGNIHENLMTAEEKMASALRTEIMLELKRARNERGISQKKLEEISGVRQTVIARMERGSTSPQIDTLLKVLASLGKTLYVGDLP